jgi:Putative peptidoglycan binding domain
MPRQAFGIQSSFSTTFFWWSGGWGEGKNCLMRSIKGSFAGLVLAAILAVVFTSAAFARGGGGVSHGGAGYGDSLGRGSHSSGYVGHGFGPQQGEQFAPHYRHRGSHRYRGSYPYGDPYWYDYPYYGYYDDDDRDYSDAQSRVEPAAVEQTNIAVQQGLAKLSFYSGQVDGQIDLGTQKAISCFQTVEKLPVTGRVDAPTLNALQIR